MTIEDPVSGRRALASAGVRTGLAVVLALLTSPHSAGAQGLMPGLRGGGGVDVTGGGVFSAQLEFTELGSSNSVRVGVMGVGGAHLIDEYTLVHSEREYAYREATRIWSVALVANYLLGYSMGATGPYVALGLGLGPQWVDWRLESAYGRAGEPLQGGGSFLEQDGLMLGTTLNAGLGLRLHDHFDVLAQALVLVAPSTDLREDLKLMPAFLLTTGISF